MSIPAMQRTAGHDRFLTLIAHRCPAAIELYVVAPEAFAMISKPTTVAQYLASLPADRRAAMEAVRKVILANLDGGYEEGIQYGMIGYYVPHSVYPPGYHCDPQQPLPFASLASQKNHMAVYLMCNYCSPKENEWFLEAWAKTGKKLDMGKSCVRFKKLDDLALDVIGKSIARMPAVKFIANYEAVRQDGETTVKKATTKMKKATSAAKKRNSKTAGKRKE